VRSPAGRSQQSQASYWAFRQRGCVDIATALSGGENGLREATDMLLVLMQRFHTVIEHRAAYSETYQRYLAARNATTPQVIAAPR